METKPAVYSLSIGRMLALLVHYFAGYLYVYRIVATKITLAVEPGATILLPWVQLLIYVFTAGVAILLACSPQAHDGKTVRLVLSAGIHIERQFGL